MILWSGSDAETDAQEGTNDECLLESKKEFDEQVKTNPEAALLAKETERETRNAGV